MQAALNAEQLEADPDFRGGTQILEGSVEDCGLEDQMMTRTVRNTKHRWTDGPRTKEMPNLV